ncbi:MAG: hypothetical protein PWP23_2945 [Candidatus Sumerlaeota bacterium]|nr:hypothetical protein [Candidatus Sumerlaeota bacterium]
MTPSAKERKCQTRESLLTAAAVAALALVYVTHPARSAEVRDLVGGFYAPLRHQGISLDGAHVVRHIESGEYTAWTHLTAREAFARWRMRGDAPEAWDRLHARWAEGFWEAPARVGLEQAFAANVAKWESAREETAAGTWSLAGAELPEAGWTIEIHPENVRRDAPEAGRKDALHIPVVRDSPSVSLLLFPPETTTAEMGTTLRLLVDGDSLRDPLAAPVLYWGTESLAISPWRAKGAVTRFDAETKVVVYEYNFASEPGWFTPGAQCAVLRFDLVPENDTIRVLGIEGE